MATKKIPIGSDINLYFRNVKDRTGAVVSDAVCSFTITTKYPKTAPVTLGSGTLNYTGSGGNYEGLVGDSVTGLIEENQYVYINLVAETPGGKTRRARIEGVGSYDS